MRYHADAAAIDRNHREHLRKIHRWETPVRDIDLQRGRFRKQDSYDCGKPHCIWCHREKVLGIPTRQQVLSDLDFHEQLYGENLRGYKGKRSPKIYCLEQRRMGRSGEPETSWYLFRRYGTRAAMETALRGLTNGVGRFQDGAPRYEFRVSPFVPVGAPTAANKDEG